MKKQKNEKVFSLIEDAEKEKLPSTLFDRATIHGHYFKGVIIKGNIYFLRKGLCSLWYFVINDFEKLNLPVISKPVRNMISNFQKEKGNLRKSAIRIFIEYLNYLREKKISFKELNYS